MHSALCAGVCEQGLEWALRERQPCRCLAAARQKSDHRLNAAPAGEKLRKNQSHVPAAACHCLPLLLQTKTGNVLQISTTF